MNGLKQRAIGALWPIFIGAMAGTAAAGFLLDWTGLSGHSYLAFPRWLFAVTLGGVGGAALGLLVTSPPQGG
ncbi:hypothetical protein [Polaromonas sp.]|uniref:hypothetical protein n=1 Tax=Polaromonas sp. TaxID=1869339 RepID=UPI003752B4C8